MLKEIFLRRFSDKFYLIKVPVGMAESGGSFERLFLDVRLEVFALRVFLIEGELSSSERGNVWDLQLIDWLFISLSASLLLWLQSPIYVRLVRVERDDFVDMVDLGLDSPVLPLQFRTNHSLGREFGALLNVEEMMDLSHAFSPINHSRLLVRMQVGVVLVQLHVLLDHIINLTYFLLGIITALSGNLLSVHLAGGGVGFGQVVWKRGTKILDFGLRKLFVFIKSVISFHSIIK